MESPSLPSLQTPQSMSTFPLFSRLPTELRLKIYSHAADFPKIHYINLPRISRTSPKLPSSALLYTCHESREVVLRAHPSIMYPMPEQMRVYFNCEQDVLYLAEIARLFDGLLSWSHRTGMDGFVKFGLHLENVRAVGFAIDVGGRWRSVLDEIMKETPKLELVLLVLPQKDEVQIGNTKEVHNPRLTSFKGLRTWGFGEYESSPTFGTEQNAGEDFAGGRWRYIRLVAFQRELERVFESIRRRREQDGKSKIELLLVDWEDAKIAGLIA